MLDLVPSDAPFPLLWIPLALLSALLTAARQLYIKRHCAAVPADILVFITRSVGFVLLAGWAALYGGLQVQRPGLFLMVLTITVGVTAVATVIQVSIIQREEISLSVPFLGFIPVLMIPWSALLLGEWPSPGAGAGIVIASIGAYLMDVGPGRRFWRPLMASRHARGPRWMLAVAVMLGLTTTCDKLAIAASSALTYLVIWMGASAGVMGYVFLRHSFQRVRSSLGNPHILVQSGLWAGAFSAQMSAVAVAMPVESGTAYVKTLTLTSILITVAVGGRLFSESNRRRRLLATLLILLGAVAIVLNA